MNPGFINQKKYNACLMLHGPSSNEWKAKLLQGFHLQSTGISSTENANRSSYFWCSTGAGITDTELIQQVLKVQQVNKISMLTGAQGAQGAQVHSRHAGARICRMLQVLKVHKDKWYLVEHL